MRRGSHNWRGGGRGGIHQQGQAQNVPPPPALEAVVGRLETISRLLLAVGRNSTRPEEIHEEIGLIYKDLTRVGPNLEATYPDVLDRVISSMRDASAQPSLPPPLRLAIFQLVELRASHWSLPQDTTNYYTQRSNLHQDKSENHECGNGDNPPSEPIPNQQKSFLQEVVIKNSDSGKVLPNAKDRTLFINGSSENSIQIAKDLIGETIERNASPVLEVEPKPSALNFDQPSPSSLSPSAEGPDYSYSIQLGQDVIRISGTHLPFVQEAKLALDEHFLRKFPHLFYGSSPRVSDIDLSLVELSPVASTSLIEKQKWRYDRKTLLEIEQECGSQQPPPEFLTTLDPSILGSIALHKRRVLDPGFINQNCDEKKANHRRPS